MYLYIFPSGNKIFTMFLYAYGKCLLFFGRIKLKFVIDMKVIVIQFNNIGFCLNKIMKGRLCIILTLFLVSNKFVDLQVRSATSKLSGYLNVCLRENTEILFLYTMH